MDTSIPVSTGFQLSNKGTAFTHDERRAHGLEDLLPHAVETLDRQFKRAMGLLAQQPDDLASIFTLSMRNLRHGPDRRRP